MSDMATMCKCVEIYFLSCAEQSSNTNEIISRHHFREARIRLCWAECTMWTGSANTTCDGQTITRKLCFEFYSFPIMFSQVPVWHPILWDGKSHQSSYDQSMSCSDVRLELISGERFWSARGIPGSLLNSCRSSSTISDPRISPSTLSGFRLIAFWDTDCCWRTQEISRMCLDH